MVKWVGHRGESADAPENTLASFKLALERDLDAIEVDIHLTKDKQVACSHDVDTMRRCGVSMLVTETDYAELAKLDAGNGEKIPLFSEVLALLKDYPAKKIFVELKGEDQNLIPAMKEVINASGIDKSQVVIISFHPDMVRECKRLYPEIPVLLLIGIYRLADRGVSVPNEELSFALMLGCGADGMDIRSYPEVVTPELIDRVHAIGKKIALWTVDDPDEAAYFVKLGVDAITSNRAAALRDGLA